MKQLDVTGIFDWKEAIANGTDGHDWNIRSDRSMCE